MFARLLSKDKTSTPSPTTDATVRGVEGTVGGVNGHANSLAEREALLEKCLSNIAEKAAADARIAEAEATSKLADARKAEAENATKQADCALKVTDTKNVEAEVELKLRESRMLEAAADIQLAATRRSEAEAASLLAETRKAELELELNLLLLSIEEAKATKAAADAAALAAVPRKLSKTPQQLLIEDVVRELYIALDAAKQCGVGQCRSPCLIFQKVIDLNRIEFYGENGDFEIVEILSTYRRAVDTNSNFEYCFKQYVEHINILKNNCKISPVLAAETKRLAEAYKAVFLSRTNSMQFSNQLSASIGMTEQELLQFMRSPKPSSASSALHVFADSLSINPALTGNATGPHNPVSYCKKIIAACNADLSSPFVRNDVALFNLIENLLNAANSCLTKYCLKFYRDNDVEITNGKVRQLFGNKEYPLYFLSQLVQCSKWKYDASLGFDEDLKHACEGCVSDMEIRFRESLEWTKGFEFIPKSSVDLPTSVHLVSRMLTYFEHYSHLHALAPVLRSISKVGTKRSALSSAPDADKRQIWAELKTAEEEARVEIEKVWEMEHEM